MGAMGGVRPRVAKAQDDDLEANKQLGAEIYDEVINNRNTDALLDYAAPGAVEHRREGDVTYATPEDFVAATTADLEGIPPDMQVTIDYQIAEGDQVLNHLIVEAADEGISVSGFSVFRIVDGKIVELDELIDEAGIMMQMGMTPGLEGEVTGEEGAAEEGNEIDAGEEVIADGFNGPMGILLDDDGNIWVVDSGVGGDEEISMPDPESGEEMTVTIGEPSRVVMVAPDGTQTEVATLPSVLQGGEASGGNRLALLDGALYATSGGWLEAIPVDRMPLMAAVVSIREDGTVEEVANTWDYEVENNPDGFVIEAHPYGLAAGPDGLLWVADAGANAVYTVDPESGEVTLVATIGGVEGPMPNPGRGDAMEMDPVPTGIVPTEDGGAYVSLLPGFPFTPGSSKVVYVSPDGEVSDYATGLTMITDLRMGPDGELYGVQIAEFTDQGPTPGSGAIWRIHEGDGSEVLYSGLSFPTSVDFNAGGDAYITTNGVGAPGSGNVTLVHGLTTMAGHAGEEEAAGEGEAAEVLPVPEAAMGPEIPADTGYVVEEIGRGLYWVTDGTYQIMFAVTGEGVIVVDAPPSMGDKILSAIADVTDEPITHVIYSHAHADHIAGAGMYPADATYIAQANTAATLEARGADDESQDLPFGVLVGGGPVPLPTETFDDEYTLEVDDQTLELAYLGANHTDGNIFIYAPEQKVLMVVDLVFPGWSPFRDLAVSESAAGYLAAIDQILDYDFDIYIGGHVGRYGTREDVEDQKAYFEDIKANALQALQTVDFNAIVAETGFENPWLLFNTYLDVAAQECADLTIEQWGDTLAGVDLNSFGHCDRVIESMRVD
jgi:glyoxylase-like metal-dependent hydrolase (beta-lactamase superfamily II)/predicted SnoaL-like aldol condensation-catalyzing enzyme